MLLWHLPDTRLVKSISPYAASGQQLRIRRVCYKNLKVESRRHVIPGLARVTECYLETHRARIFFRMWDLFQLSLQL